MISYRALISSIILSLLLALITLGLARFDLIVQFFEPKVTTQVSPIVNLTLCGLSLSSYSIVGAFYAYLAPHSHKQPVFTGVIAGFLALGSFFFELLISIALSIRIEGKNPIADFQNGLESAPPPFDDSKIIIYIGVFIGFAIALTCIFLLGAVAAFISAKILGRHRNQQAGSFK